MKKIIHSAIISGALGVGLLALSQGAIAQVSPNEVVKLMNVTTNEAVVDLNDKTVVCSHIGYSMPLLKVNIDKLADLTFLDHRNAGAGGPCVFTPGLCDLELQKKLTDPNKPAEKINITVQESKILTPDEENNVCLVVLKEEVSTVIRGIPFQHEKETQLPSRLLEDCR